MISEAEAHKVWSRDTRVIRRGEPGWRSDHPERRDENFGFNPLSTVKFRSMANWNDVLGLPQSEGDERTWADEGDLLYFEARIDRDGDLYWRLRYRVRNGVHHAIA